MQKYVKEIGDERLTKVPADLDEKPYRDEHDTDLPIFPGPARSQLRRMESLSMAYRSFRRRIKSHASDSHRFRVRELFSRCPTLRLVGGLGRHLTAVWIAYQGAMLWSRLERSPRRDQLQSCPDCPLGIILMGLGVAKIDQHAVAQILSHEPAETAHSFSGAF